MINLFDIPMLYTANVRIEESFVSADDLNNVVPLKEILEFSNFDVIIMPQEEHLATGVVNVTFHLYHIDEISEILIDSLFYKELPLKSLKVFKMDNGDTYLGMHALLT